MKNIAKILLLGLLTVGMTTGCDLNKFLPDSSSQDSAQQLWRFRFTR